jgi:DNA-binding NarL/FixJ family response regulator
MTDPTPRDLRILLLEDDSQDAEMVTRALERTGPAWLVQCVATEAEYASALESFVPDVILSDHSLSDFGPLEALRLAQRSRPGSPFLIVSHTCEPSVFECLKAGAADFVEKSDLARLRPAITAALEARAPLRKLSNRQLEVLQLLTAGSSTRRIAERLGLSVKTVETHRAQVMKRLGIRDLAGLVRFSIHVGLVSAAA